MGSCCSSGSTPVDQQAENSRAIDAMLADHSPLGQWNAMNLVPPLGTEDLIPQQKVGWVAIGGGITGRFHHGTGVRPVVALVSGFRMDRSTEYCFPPDQPDQPYGGDRGAESGRFVFVLPPNYQNHVPKPAGVVSRLWGQDGFIYEVDLNAAPAFTMGGVVADAQEIAVMQNIGAGAIRLIAKRHRGRWTIIYDSTDHTDGGWMPNMRALYAN